MVKTHVLGFPRIGENRELKKLVEAYWNGKISEEELDAKALELKKINWKRQSDEGLDFVTVGDFSYYDSILDFSIAFGVVNSRFKKDGVSMTELSSQMGRGRDVKGNETQACEMTKWFDTNYHYIVPEISKETRFHLNSECLTEQIVEAKTFGKVKFVIPGAITFLELSKIRDASIRKVDLLPELKKVYEEFFKRLKEAGVSMIQIDEPSLVTDLSEDLKDAFFDFYSQIDFAGVPVLLATYFGEVNADLKKIVNLPFDVFHFDCVRGKHRLQEILECLPSDKNLSLGVIDGRNVWKSDLNEILKEVSDVHEKLGDRLWLSASCSLLHVPVNLDNEDELDPRIKNWLAFAVQKLGELRCLKSGLSGGSSQCRAELEENRKAIESRRTSSMIHRPEVREALAGVSSDQLKRKSPFSTRNKIQEEKLGLPEFPTTSIGSFPQTSEIRKARAEHKKGMLSQEEYDERMKEEIRNNVEIQEELGIDVFVHGEPERNDMVEYFGEQLQGFAFTRMAWVQSYGSRCVKPPIIFGDVSRTAPITLEWSRYAQSLTRKKMKGMLTGPVTILQWSFVRDDQSREDTCKQIALALLDEVKDLEKAGIDVIQVDEPALREGLPLLKKDWNAYLKWACEAFRLSTSDVKDSTQIHTHMCYCEFNEIMDAIGSLDADVISIETSRSQMELLDSFKKFSYPNDIGPGVYDIHSPRIPTREEMVFLLEKSLGFIPAERLWVNPDCGLKTRKWEETKPALANMVSAARQLRTQL